jgi:hypothetical protein
VPARAAAAPRLRVVTANVLAGNTRSGDAAAALRRLKPDVLVIAELRPASLAALRRAGVLTDLPFSTVVGAPEDVEIFSRLPLRDIERASAVPGLPQPRAVISVEDVDVRLRGAHPLPPVNGYERVGRLSLAELRQEVRREDLPLIVAGDLNGDRHCHCSTTCSPTVSGTPPRNAEEACPGRGPSGCPCWRSTTSWCGTASTANSSSSNSVRPRCPAATTSRSSPTSRS